MRAREFITERAILREYKRDITARQYGDKIFDQWKANREGVSTLGDMIPGSFPTGGVLDIKDHLIDTILAAIEKYGDPTSNKIYTPWIARQYGDGNIRRLEDLDSRIKPLLAQYHQYKNKGWFPQHAKDIMRVNLHQLSSLMVNLNIPQEKQVDRGQYEEIYKDSDVRVIVPKDKTAACYYGQGTEWCTARTQSANYFDRYNQQGTLYILLPQNPKYDGEKYQLHFESGQFMNEKDDPVSPKEIIGDRFPQLQELFQKQVDNLLEFTPDDFLKELYDAAVELVAKYFNDTMLESIKNNRHNEYLDWLSARGVKLNAMTSDEFFKYENKRGYSFGEFDPGVVDVDDALHEMKWKKPQEIREYVADGQRDPGVIYNASDIGTVVEQAFIQSIAGNQNSYSWKLSSWIENHVTAKTSDYRWERGMRKFTPYKQVGDWTVGTYGPEY